MKPISELSSIEDSHSNAGAVLMNSPSKGAKEISLLTMDKSKSLSPNRRKGEPAGASALKLRHTIQPNSKAFPLIS